MLEYIWYFHWHIKVFCITLWFTQGPLPNNVLLQTTLTAQFLPSVSGVCCITMLIINAMQKSKYQLKPITQNDKIKSNRTTSDILLHIPPFPSWRWSWPCSLCTCRSSYCPHFLVYSIFHVNKIHEGYFYQELWYFICVTFGPQSAKCDEAKEAENCKYSWRKGN